MNEEFFCTACDQHYEVGLINGKDVPALFCPYCGRNGVKDVTPEFGG